jgi:CheY-like chemotaxis protein
VQDTGIGMTEAQKSQLFQPFQQADTSITRRFGGTGLGLVISERLVKLMGGDGILVDSELRKGSNFRFMLPLLSCDSIQQAEVKASLQNPNGLGHKLSGHVLLVDDNEMNQEVGKAILLGFGLEVTIATNGVMAVDLCRDRKRHFDVIIMDIQMPLMNGYEATERIRQFNKKTPIIALTAAVLIEDRDKALSVGMNAHLSKPINKKALYSLLRDMTEVTQEQMVQTERSTSLDQPLGGNCSVRICSFDFDAGLAQFDGDQETFQLLLQMFAQNVLPKVHEFIKLLDSLFEQAITEEMAQELRQTSHSLKGSISSISAVSLAQVMSDVHQKLRKGVAITAKDIARLHEAYLDTQSDLQEWLHHHQVASA